MREIEVPPNQQLEATSPPAAPKKSGVKRLLERSQELERQLQERELELARVQGDINALFLEKERWLRQAEASLKKLHHIVDSIHDGFALCDRHFCITYINPPTLQTLNITLAQTLGVCIWDEYPPDECPEFYAACHQALNEQVPISVEQYYRPLDRWAEIRVFPHEDGLGIFFRDITEKRLLEEQLLQAKKMESIGRLAGGVAHDFNNLLTAIIGYADLATEELSNDHPAQRHLNNLLEASERAADLTRQLLAFARKQHILPRTVNLNRLLLDIRTILQSLLGATIRLHIQPAESEVMVSVDSSQMEQVLINLAVNARDAMPEGGEVTISLHTQTLSEAESTLPPGTYVRLEFVDTGTGMSPEVQARIFEPFFTTKSPEQGTGLGLATCYGIIMQSGGTITVRSSSGEGTCFTILLPKLHTVAGESLERAHEKPPRLPASTETEGKGTILLAEDEEMVRQIIAHTLRSRGYTVFEATSGIEALHIAMSKTETIDLLVTDLVMPKMGGRELAEHIREICPDIRILYLSGFAEGTMMPDLEKQEAGALLQKPFTSETLACAVRSLLKPSE